MHAFFTVAVGLDFILIDDNVRPHRAYLVNEFLESEDIRWMDMPVRSPHLIRIQHAWDARGRAIATPNPLPRTIRRLKP
ncbi:DDE_3 domain-containing protein [Trichonephila clavipes]|nr:DDE_3 domain-containing protein [Trichonephila clavipes]